MNSHVDDGARVASPEIRGEGGLQRVMVRALVLAQIVAPVSVRAQVVATPGANAPNVVQTANGLPQVNITAPTPGGVSKNVYSQFDVPRQGVILNNSPTIVNTQQAGYVNGNPNLARDQAARVILNQVNSQSPSQLRGYLEVAGKAAQVVVANSAGIMVDGGGFINTTRGVLTTGTPIMGADGSLTGYQVNGGRLVIQGDGLNASNVDQVDLIARAVQVNAALHAKQLNVVTGTNRVEHADLSVQKTSGDSEAPDVAVDVGQLGGMYAQRIFLLGTEHGVGVSNQGVIAAQAGDLTLTTEGKLTATGRTLASGDMTVAADAIDLSGIQAGDGGFDVSVAGNTDLKGAYLASTADASQNQLTTGTLTFSDIENHSDYSANSFGFGGGFTTGNGGANERKTGATSGKNTGGISPMLPQMESGSERATTYSGVSEGGITLTNGANQTQDIASLNRDTTDLNGTVNRTPDLQNLLGDQSRLMAAATAAGEAVARDIGTYANKKEQEARDLAKATTDPELKAQYLQEAKDWSEGGDYRAAMHAAGGAIVAGLGGGNALGGALGAGLTSKAGSKLNELSDQIRDSRPTGNADVDQALAQIVATGVGTAVGAAVGGSSGAFTGFNTDRFNRQLQPTEKALARRIAEDATRKGLINPDGSVITASQIENAMRSANNSALGESAWTGSVVPLNANTQASAIYDTTGMRVFVDYLGNKYLVQDSAMLSPPSDGLRDLIVSNTGGKDSPYNWNVPASEWVSKPIFTDAERGAGGPFSDGWNTGDYSARIRGVGRGIGPDYASVGTGSLSASATGAVNLHDGTTYASAGVTQHIPRPSWAPGASATIGWVLGERNAHATNAFLDGDGKQAYVSIPTPFRVNFVMAITKSYGGATAIELGLGNIGRIDVGVTPWSRSTNIVDINGN